MEFRIDTFQKKELQNHIPLLVNSTEYLNKK